MRNLKTGRTFFGLLCLCLNPILSVENLGAETVYLRPANDSNYRVEIKDAIVKGDETTILFWTWPIPGNPNYGKPCPVNFYTVTVRKGLTHSEPQLAAKEICAGPSLIHAGLLENDAAKLLAKDRLEEWLAGKPVSRDSFSTIKEVGTLRVNAGEMGSQFLDFSPAGDVLMGISVSGYSAADWPDSSSGASPWWWPSPCWPA